MTKQSPPSDVVRLRVTLLRRDGTGNEKEMPIPEIAMASRRNRELYADESRIATLKLFDKEFGEVQE